MKRFTQKGGGASRRHREKMAHRAEILAAAERVFKKKGLEAAKMEDIAREAEFSVGALYTFFRNKHELCSAVLGMIANEFIRNFELNVVSVDDGLDALRELVRLRLSHMRAHRDFFRMMLAAKPESSISPDMVLLKDLRVMYDDYVGKVSKLFQKAMKQGRIKRMDPLYAALALEGVLNAFSAHWGAYEKPEALEKLTGIVWDNYLSHIAAKTV